MLVDSSTTLSKRSGQKTLWLHLPLRLVTVERPYDAQLFIPGRQNDNLKPRGSVSES